MKKFLHIAIIYAGAILALAALLSVIGLAETEHWAEAFLALIVVAALASAIRLVPEEWMAESEGMTLKEWMEKHLNA